ncbi:UNVERIFIED_CONTAM: hypothetical protein Sradi_2981100 [Sesamum radiatum]|uniref:Uncharacterized protein n=1 Tax=Sesamum radiatum TaxID=300843 RepID=A0AAW2S0H8_SESRA
MACAAARVDASWIKANKASCVNYIIASWGGTLGGGGSMWGVVRLVHGVHDFFIE